VPVRIEAVEDLGSFKIVTTRLGSRAVKVRVPEDEPLPAGPPALFFPPQWTRLYADGRLVA
jgi:glycerol transport system ATP-binding protein